MLCHACLLIRGSHERYMFRGVRESKMFLLCSIAGNRQRNRGGECYISPEMCDRIERETRFYITSLVLLANQLGPVIRSRKWKRWRFRQAETLGGGEQPALGDGHDLPGR